MKNLKFIDKILKYVVLLGLIIFFIIFGLPKVYDYIINIEENKLVKDAEKTFKQIEKVIEENDSNIKECKIEKNGNLLCDDYIEIKTNLSNKSTYGGLITLNNKKIIDVEFYINDDMFIKNSKNKLELVHKFCEAVTDSATGNIPKGEYIPGDEYICEVKKGTKYTFFVLSINEDNTINLILDRNIYYNKLLNTSNLSSSKNGANKKEKGLIRWGGYSNGPFNVMDYVYYATKNWNYVPNIHVDYNTLLNNDGDDFIYLGIKTIGNITAIMKHDGTPAKVLNNRGGYEDLKARLPYKEELSNFNNDNLWMYNYLSNSNKVKGNGLQNIDGIYGYWTLSQSSGNPYQVWWLDYNGTVTKKYGAATSYYGVRPVITISKNNIK